MFMSHLHVHVTLSIKRFTLIYVNHVYAQSFGLCLYYTE